MTGPPIPPGVPSPLELRYRRLLRVLPREYRAIRGDEMVGTFLAAQEDADPENFDLTLKHGSPGWAETRSVLALAVSQRWGENVAPERYRVRVEGLWSATVMVLTVLWTGAVCKAFSWAWTLAFPPVDAGGFDPFQALFGLPAGSWQWLLTWAPALFLPALPLVVFGGRAGARWAAACVAVPAAVLVAAIVRNISVTGTVWLGDIAGVLVDVGLIAALWAVGSAKFRSAPRRPWHYLVAGVAATAVFNAVLAVYHLAPAAVANAAAIRAVGYVFIDTQTPWCPAVIVGALWIMARRLRGRTTTMGGLFGLAVLAGAATLYRALSGADTMPGLDLSNADLRPYGIAIIVQFGLTATIFVILVALVSRRVRELPARAYPPEASPASH